MGIFCDRLKFGSTAALDCPTGQNKGRYHEKRGVALHQSTRSLEDSTLNVKPHYVEQSSSNAMQIW